MSFSGLDRAEQLELRRRPLLDHAGPAAGESRVHARSRDPTAARKSGGANLELHLLSGIGHATHRARIARHRSRGEPSWRDAILRS